MTQNQLNKLTKAQLIDHIKDLETQTISYKWEHFILEVQLLVEDAQKSLKYVFNQGVQARKAVEIIRQPILVDKSKLSLH